MEACGNYWSHTNHRCLWKWVWVTHSFPRIDWAVHFLGLNILQLLFFSDSVTKKNHLTAAGFTAFSGRQWAFGWIIMFKKNSDCKKWQSRLTSARLLLWFVVTYEHLSPAPVEDKISEILAPFFKKMFSVITVILWRLFSVINILHIIFYFFQV